MKSFNQFIMENWEDYSKATPERRAELSVMHKKLADEHNELFAKHKELKTSGKDPNNSFEHNIASDAHRSAAAMHDQLSHMLVSKNKNGQYNYNNSFLDDNKVQANKLSNGANDRSKLIK